MTRRGAETAYNIGFHLRNWALAANWIDPWYYNKDEVYVLAS